MITQPKYWPGGGDITDDTNKGTGTETSGGTGSNGNPGDDVLSNARPGYWDNERVVIDDGINIGDNNDGEELTGDLKPVKPPVQQCIDDNTNGNNGFGLTDRFLCKKAVDEYDKPDWEPGITPDTGLNGIRTK